MFVRYIGYKIEHRFVYEVINISACLRDFKRSAAWMDVTQGGTRYDFIVRDKRASAS